MVAFATAYSMILSANSWRALSMALRRRRSSMSRLSVSRSAYSPMFWANASSASGRTFSRSSLTVHREVGGWPASDASG